MKKESLRETEKQAKERRATTGVVADVVRGELLAAHSLDQQRIGLRRSVGRENTKVRPHAQISTHIPFAYQKADPT
jgi:hypothetical protein